MDWTVWALIVRNRKKNSFTETIKQENRQQYTVGPSVNRENNPNPNVWIPSHNPECVYQAYTIVVQWKVMFTITCGVKQVP